VVAGSAADVRTRGVWLLCIFMKKVIKGTAICVLKGDICRDDSYCIVNAANEHLSHGGGVAGAISSKGGPSIQQESNALVRERGIVPTGSAVVTGPGRLPCKYVIHAVGPVYRGGSRGEAEQLKQAILSSYARATELSATSIALPAISSGIFGYPKNLVAEVFFSTTIEYLEHNETSLTTIKFLNFDDPTVNVFTAEFTKRFTNEHELSDVELSEEGSAQRLKKDEEGTAHLPEDEEGSSQLPEKDEEGSAQLPEEDEESSRQLPEEDEESSRQLPEEDEESSRQLPEKNEEHHRELPKSRTGIDGGKGKLKSGGKVAKDADKPRNKCCCSLL
jgi:putative ATPase